MASTTRIAGAVVALVTLVALGCSGPKQPPPQPPSPTNVVYLPLGEVSAVDSLEQSHAVSLPVRLTTNATLRIDGSYRFVEPNDVPVFVQISQVKQGRTVIAASAAQSKLEKREGTYEFTVDVLAPQRAGDYDLALKAGERALARATVVVENQKK